MVIKEFSITIEQVRSTLELIRQADEGDRMYRVAAHQIRNIMEQVQREPRAPVGSGSGFFCAVCHKDHTAGFFMCTDCFYDILHRAERYNTTCQSCMDGYTINCCKTNPCPKLQPGQAQPAPNTWRDMLCPKHSYCRVNNGNPDAIMHFCDGVELTRHFREVHQGTLVQELRDAVKARSFTDTDGDFHEVGLTPEEIEDCITKSMIPEKRPAYITRVIQLITEEEENRIKQDAVKAVCKKILEYEKVGIPDCKNRSCSGADPDKPCIKCIVDQAMADVIGEQKK